MPRSCTCPNVLLKCKENTNSQMSLLMTREAATSLSQRSNLTVTSIRYINIVPRLEQKKEFISVRYVSITYYICRQRLPNNSTSLTKASVKQCPVFTALDLLTSENIIISKSNMDSIVPIHQMMHLCIFNY